MLTASLRLPVTQFAELQHKYLHFQQVDMQQVQDVRAMHDADLRALREQVVTADRIIHEQLLGFHWRAPSNPTNPLCE